MPKSCEVPAAGLRLGRDDHRLGAHHEFVRIDLLVGDVARHPHQLLLPFQQAQAHALLRVFDVALDRFLLAVHFLEPQVPEGRNDGGQADLAGDHEDQRVERTLGIATGKSRRGLDRSLDATGLKPFFRASRCADETHPKPHPAMLLELMAELEVRAEGALMIGDTSHDLEMARAAGVDALAVTYGAHAEEGLRSCQPRACVASVPELDRWLTQHG